MSNEEDREPVDAPTPEDDESIDDTISVDPQDMEELPPPPKAKRKYVRKDPHKKITRKRSAEHNEKIAKALRGRTLDPAHRDAIAQSMMGNTNRSGQ